MSDGQWLALALLAAASIAAVVTCALEWAARRRVEAAWAAHVAAALEVCRG